MPSATRPPGRTARVEARVTPAEKRLIERAARSSGMSVSAFIVASARRGAQPSPAPIHIILDEQASVRLAGALGNPPPANARLRRALADYGSKLATGRLQSLP